MDPAAFVSAGQSGLGYPMSSPHHSMGVHSVQGQSHPHTMMAGRSSLPSGINLPSGTNMTGFPPNLGSSMSSGLAPNMQNVQVSSQMPNVGNMGRFGSGQTGLSMSGGVPISHAGLHGINTLGRGGMNLAAMGNVPNTVSPSIGNPTIARPTSGMSMGQLSNSASQVNVGMGSAARAGPGQMGTQLSGQMNSGGSRIVGVSQMGNMPRGTVGSHNMGNVNTMRMPNTQGNPPFPLSGMLQPGMNTMGPVPGYPQSGDFMAMMSKGGLSSSNPPNYSAAVSLNKMPSAMSMDGTTKDPEVVSELGTFDLSEFPALSGNKAPKYSSAVTKQNEFVIQNEDFPALPGFKGSTDNIPSSNSQSYLVSPQSPAPGLRSSSGNIASYEQFMLQQQQQQQQSQLNRSAQMQGTIGQPTPQTSLPPKPPQDKALGTLPQGGVDRFGLMGLLSVISMTDPDLNTLALGTDLTLLGLNLNAADSLYAMFISPFADPPQKREPEYFLPPCYYMQPPMLPPSSKLTLFSEETLFYIFYSMPRDALQVAAAQELYNREWRFHKELKLWFTRAPGSDPKGAYIYFDVNTWEKVRKDNFG